MDSETARRDLLEIYNAAIQAVNGRLAVRKALQTKTLPQQELAVIAIGKAAVDMALGVQDVLGKRIVKGLVITKLGYTLQSGELAPGFQILEAEHPVPGKGSLFAGESLLSFCHDLGTIDSVIVCISGGASSLVEVLPAGLRLEDIQELTREMLASGLDIGRINAVRRRLSQIKGGRLATRLRGREVRALYISDVPEDDVAVIGSGLLAAKAETSSVFGDDLFQLPDMPQVLFPDSPVFEQITHQVVANLDLAMAAAKDRAVALGYTVHLHTEFLDQSVEQTATRVMEILSAAPAGLHIWGGETVVNLPENPGRGGRNQQLALCLADLIRDDAAVVALAAGTDGSDGVTDDAGALVDGGTIARGAVSDRDFAQDLAAFNANAFLEASGDLITTGPTGTNVTDLLLIYRD